MSEIRVQMQLSTEKLLEAVVQMSETEFDRFVKRATKLRSKHTARKLSRRESELIQKINQGIPTHIRQRFDELYERRQDETLTKAEYNELLELNTQIEKLNVERIESLGKLAHLWKKNLTQVMDELGITPQYE
jgi:phosphotransacetylase